jgi:hypothetical protein
MDLEGLESGERAGLLMEVLQQVGLRVLRKVGKGSTG